MKVYKKDDMNILLKDKDGNTYAKIRSDKIIYNPKSNMMFAYALDRNRYVLFGVFPTSNYEIPNYESH